MPPVDLSKLPVSRSPFQYTRRDVILYAVAEGASWDDHKFVWERHPEFETLPTYPTVLGQKGDGFELRKWEDMSRGGFNIPGVKLDPQLFLDGGRTIEWLAPIPTSGKGEIVGQTTGVYDVGQAAVIETTSTVIVDGVEVCKIIGQLFARGGGGFGGPRPPKDPNPVEIPKDRAPDAIQEIPIPLNQTLIYRLSGDTMPQHVDLELAKRMNWPRPIVMGLGTYGMTARAVLRHFAANQQTRMQKMSGRFAAVVYPGETLYVEMWKVREDADTVTVAYQSRVKERKGPDGKDLVVMSQGSAVCRKKGLKDTVPAKL
ncbi:HotDog domain-containing protein [Hyaloraphidium curvatum]|nr:HotDog domain-containing protein [Hyaloraphidium curvatum]